MFFHNLPLSTNRFAKLIQISTQQAFHTFAVSFCEAGAQFPDTRNDGRVSVIHESQRHRGPREKTITPRVERAAHCCVAAGVRQIQALRVESGTLTCAAPRVAKDLERGSPFGSSTWQKWRKYAQPGKACRRRGGAGDEPVAEDMRELTPNPR